MKYLESVQRKVNIREKFTKGKNVKSTKYATLEIRTGRKHIEEKKMCKIIIYKLC